MKWIHREILFMNFVGKSREGSMFLLTYDALHIVNFSHFIIQILVVRLVFVKYCAQNKRDKFV